MSEPQAWFAAVLLLSSEVRDASGEIPLVDHQVRLIHAVDAEDAYQRARELGEAAQHAYLNEAGETVSWHFVGVYQLQELADPPAHGTEVYSWFNREGERVRVPGKAELDVFKAVGIAGSHGRSDGGASA
jgi:hypothetical protein